MSVRLASERNACSNRRPTRPTCASSSATDELVQEAQRRAAREKIAAVGATVIAEGNGVRDLLADEGCAYRAARRPSACRFETRCRLEPKSGEVERYPRAAEPLWTSSAMMSRAGFRRGFSIARQKRPRERLDSALALNRLEDMAP